MNCQEYLAHVAQVAGITIPPGTEYEDALELMAGLFQKFRPSGEGIDKLFAPLEDGPALAERMKKIYFYDMARGTGDYFFIPGPADDNLEDSVDMHVQQFMQNLLTLLPADTDAHQVLAAIEDTEYVAPEEVYNTDSEEYAALFDDLSDWEMEHSDDDHPLSVLEEAFYTVNMDPWLVLWMKWPVIGKGIAVDVFEPYFQMWSLGGWSCRPVGTVMKVGR